MNSIEIEVGDFTVKYKQSEHPYNVEVYIDGDLVEETQPTWFMSKLLDEALRLKNNVK